MAICFGVGRRSTASRSVSTRDLPDNRVPSFHPVFRTQENGRLRMEMVVEIIQSTQAHSYQTSPRQALFHSAPASR